MTTTTQPIVFSLPWPSPKLSPNRRQHWAALAKAKREYRKACWAAVLQQRVRIAGHGPWNITFQFSPPPNVHTYDDDNMVARMKAGRDGMCDALQIDDKHLRLQAPLRGAKVKGGCVWVRIETVISVLGVG